MEQAEIDKMLIDAAIDGNVDNVREALRLGADIHATNDYALRMAAKNGRTETVDLLLSRGADFHVNDDYILHMAAQDDYEGVAIALLRHGVDPNAPHGQRKNAFEDTNLAIWVDELKQAVSENFTSDKPSRAQCFINHKLRDKVLGVCVTGQFVKLIGAPLVASTDHADRQLFQDIWDALPKHWQDNHQNMYVQFVAEGGVNPIVDFHTIAAKRNTRTSGILVER